MSQSNLHRKVTELFKKAALLEAKGVPTREGLERIEEARRISRRNLLKAAGLAALATTPVAGLARTLAAGPRIAIVGGGLAGISCADRLRAKGYSATLYDANTRLGGRCFSNRTLVDGMAVENGGELIDTGHKTMINYAREFGLPLESYIKMAGEERFFFNGQHHDEVAVVDEFRAVVQHMQPDLHAISGLATFFSHNDADVQLDNTDLATYFASRCAGHPLIEEVLNEAYVAEYGLETFQQSTLNFLGFMRLNRQSKFEPFGVSDERFHVRTGNDGIAAGIEDRLTGPALKGAKLTKLAKNAAGEFLLYFNGSNVPEKSDIVVLAVPFSVLREVTLDPSLGLSADKRRAIDTLSYGTNAKTMVAFNGRPWAELHGASGTVYSDLDDLQNTWESNRANSSQFGVITDYASGQRGASLKANKVQQQVDAFLTDYDAALPGTKARAAMSGGSFVAHLEHWPSNPLVRGSYTCYTTGQFTTVAGLEGPSAGLLKFAGEHADSFYSWQGYMEGACISGVTAANEVLADIKAGRV